MRIKAIQLLRVEEFPSEHQKWLSKLVFPINQFIDQGVSLLNGGLTFADNNVGTDYTWTFTYQSDAVTFPRSLNWTYKLSPSSLWVTQALEGGLPITVVAGWKFTQTVQNQALQAQTPSVQLLSCAKVSTTTITVAGNTFYPIVPLTVGTTYQIRTRITP